MAFLGPEASFLSIAASEMLGFLPKRISVQSIQDVFLAVENREADWGVVPLENSTEGTVSVTLDRLAVSPLNIVKEHELRISLSLLSLCSGLSPVKRRYFNPQSMRQCRAWLNANLPNAELVAVNSTTTEAAHAAEEVGTATVASKATASGYGLNILADDIEDLNDNYTRFFLIGHEETKSTGADKTTIVCTVKDNPLAELGINMLKIESRPDRKKAWEYHFYIDFWGHAEDGNIKIAIDRMKEEMVFLRCSDHIRLTGIKKRVERNADRISYQEGK